jgi:hypothetical protein
VEPSGHGALYLDLAEINGGPRAEEGDLEGLEELLVNDVVLHGDGGGRRLPSHVRSTAAPGWRAR